MHGLPGLRDPGGPALRPAGRAPGLALRGALIPGTRPNRARPGSSAFLALLHEDREAREALARLVRDETLDRLATEVHALAQAQRGTEERLAALTARVGQLASRVDQLAVRMDELAQAQRRTEERLEVLAARMEELTAQVGNLRGEALERRYREQAPSYFSGIARRVRVLQLEQLDRILDEAVAKQAISDDDAEEVRLADLVLVGRSDPEGTPVYLVVEASATVEARDAERAAQRAALLARAGVAALPVVAGARITVDGEQAARDREVWRVLDGRAYPPGTPVGAGAA